MKILLANLLGIFLTVSSFASGFELDSISASGLQAILPSMAASPAPSPVPAPNPLREWTIMTYLVGKDGAMESERYTTLCELEMIKTNESVAIAAELGQLTWDDSTVLKKNLWTGSKRYLVKHNTRNGIRSKPVQILPDADMGDYKHLIDFINWAKTNYPAKRYALVIEAHGVGWKDFGAKAYAYDAATKNFISTRQLGEALRQTGKIDLFYTGACLSQMVENLYEIKDSVKVAIGSEELSAGIFSNGFEVTHVSAEVCALLVNTILADPAAGTETLASDFIDGIREIWSIPYPVSFSAVRLGEMEGLGRMLDAWTASAMKLNDKNLFDSAKKNVLRFAEGSGDINASRVNSNYADLTDFIRLSSGTVVDSAEAAAFKRKSAELLNFIEKRVVINKVGHGRRSDKSNYSIIGGLSITVPPSSPTVMGTRMYTYEDLSFARNTNWDGFIFKYLWTVGGDMPFAPNFPIK